MKFNKSVIYTLFFLMIMVFLALGTLLTSCDILVETESDMAETSNEQLVTDNGEDPNLELEAAPLMAFSLDELNNEIEKVKEEKKRTGGTRTANNIESIEFYYTPVNIPEGFYLARIAVNSTRFFYYYMPEETKDADKNFDYNRGIKITVARMEAEDALVGLESQSGMRRNEDGILYDRNSGWMIKQVGNTWVMVEVPLGDLNNYNFMKNMLEMEKVIVE